MLSKSNPCDDVSLS
jgi:hypothetical protein